MNRVFFLVLLATQTLFAQVYHADQKTTDMHTPFRWVWADSAARVAQATTKRDTTKIGYQVDDFSVWYLVDSLPTWNRVGTYKADSLTVAGTITADSLNARSGEFTGTLNVDSLHSTKGITATTGTFSGALSSTTLNTGNGNYELFAMDQDVLTTSSPTFVTVTGALSGNATTATTATNVSGGSVSATTGTFSGTVSAPTFSGALSGNATTATTATTATNVSGGTVNASTGAFSGDVNVGGDLTVYGVFTTDTIRGHLGVFDYISVSGVANDTVGFGPFVQISSPTTSDYSIIQQSNDGLTIYLWNGSGWVERLKIGDTGPITAAGGFVGALTGNATTATTATTATNVSGGTVNATNIISPAATIDTMGNVKFGGTVRVVDRTQGWGTMRVVPYTDYSEAMIGFFQDAAGASTSTAWAIGQGGYTAGGFRIGQGVNQFFGIDSGTGNITIGTGAGATGTPNKIIFNNEYSNSKADSSLKIVFYDGGTPGTRYGLSLGAAGDMQYHSGAYHYFMVANDSIMVIKPTSITCYRNIIGTTAQFVSNGTSSGITITGDNGNIDRIQANGTNGELYIEATDQIVLSTPHVDISSDSMRILNGFKLGSPIADLAEFNYFDTGSFPCTLSTSYVTVQQTGRIKYQRTGYQVTLQFPQIEGTSNSAGLYINFDGPSNLAPNDQVIKEWNVEDNGSRKPGNISIDENFNGATFQVFTGTSYSTAGFTSSGTKGLTNLQPLTYLIN